jgi:polyhydroxyalkanoate synthesis repressor PhaR
MPEGAEADTPLVIKKYPNRRFYDSTRSRHVKLDEIYQLVRAGRRVQVIDSQSGADITNRVLAQIIMELDSFKLELFPPELMHQLIRSHDTLVQEFVDVYFNPAFDWFVQMREAMEQQFRRAAGLGGPTPAVGVPPWMATMAGWPTNPPTTENQADNANVDAGAGVDREGDTATEDEGSARALHERLDRLTRRVDQLRAELAGQASS